MLILILSFDISGFPPLWGNYATVFTHSLLNNGPISNELFGSHDILFTNMKFLNKIFNFLIFICCLDMESRIIIILKCVGDIAKVLRLKGSITLKAFSIYQYFSTSFCNIPPYRILEFVTIQMVQSLLQRIIIIGKNYSHGGNIYLISSSSYSICSPHLLEGL